MKQTTFFVKTGNQSPTINQLLKAADLCDGAVINNGEGFEITVTWAKNIVVDEKHIEKVKTAIKNIFESLHYCALDISLSKTCNQG